MCVWWLLLSSSRRYRNLGTAPLEGFRASVRNAEPVLRYQLSEAPAQVAAGATVTQVLMLECMQPFAAPPELVLDYTAAAAGGGQQQQQLVLALPVTLTHFMAPVYFPPPDFEARWGKLLGKLEATSTATAPASLATYPSLVGRLKQLKMLPEAWEEPVDPAHGVRCAVTLETGFRTATGNRVVVGCLAKVLLASGGQLAVTARTASEFVSGPFAATLARNLSLNAAEYS